MCCRLRRLRRISNRRDRAGRLYTSFPPAAFFDLPECEQPGTVVWRGLLRRPGPVLSALGDLVPTTGDDGHGGTGFAGSPDADGAIAVAWGGGLCRDCRGHAAAGRGPGICARRRCICAARRNLSAVPHPWRRAVVVAARGAGGDEPDRTDSGSGHSVLPDAHRLSAGDVW